MNTDKLNGHIVYPSICASMGGAEYVTYSPLVARVKIPMEREPVRVLRSKLPRFESWTSFNLAEAALAKS